MSRFALVVSTVLVLTFGLVSPAGAHVTVSASSTLPASWATLTFKVPTESDTASTTGLTVQLPADTPFTSVLTQATAGWTVKTFRTPLPKPVTDDDGGTVTSAVTKVEWTATGDGIGPGQFGTFALAVGPLPRGGTLYLPAIQHYSDGTDVDWVQQAEGGAQAEHPAPSIVVAAPAPAPVAAPAGRDGWGIGLGVAGIVLALLAGAAAGAA
ncbi:YcnI family protein, partial [Dactylosporangium sp. NPDC051485]|uniref:YcnI family copper-binding membrane protein n=1 Tax=Dactylosporangium sp. NPDC051485 TaxID=3154846 RepID=UPI003432A62D